MGPTGRSLADSQREFYQQLWQDYGDDPRSLSHRDATTQRERFFRLARTFHQQPGAFSVHEVGCGLGHFGEYLETRYPRATYSGTDICPEFVETCRRKFPGATFHLRDFRLHDPRERFDFIVLSGTFNPRVGAAPEEWRAFIDGMIRRMFDCSRCGVAVNFLSPFCDADRRDNALHYEEPWRVTEWVVQDLSRHLELDWGGPLFEFTLRVFRPAYVRQLYREAEFDRYFRGIGPDLHEPAN